MTIYDDGLQALQDSVRTGQMLKYSDVPVLIQCLRGVDTSNTAAGTAVTDAAAAVEVQCLVLDTLDDEACAADDGVTAAAIIVDVAIAVRALLVTLLADGIAVQLDLIQNQEECDGVPG